MATMLQDSFGGVAGKTSVCQAVWPHSSGEVVLQNYNTLLSIAHLNQVRSRLAKLQHLTVHRSFNQVRMYGRTDFRLPRSLASFIGRSRLAELQHALVHRSSQSGENVRTNRLPSARQSGPIRREKSSCRTTTHSCPSLISIR